MRLVCLSHRSFLGYLLVLIREFVFSTHDCIIISDGTAKALGAWRKKVSYIVSPIKLEMISEIIGHLPFPMRSTLKLLNLVEGHAQVGHFLFPL